MTDKFELKDIESKDLQAGKGGNKNSIAKIPLSQRKVMLESESSNWLNSIVIGFCLNDSADNKTALLPSRVEIYGGNSNSQFKIG